jgi:hypothetical protein
MSDKSGVAEQIVSLPKGGGELKGLGEKFKPDLQTGSGSFTIPINIPLGRNGFQPSLALNYSTGSPNGQFGLGWGLNIPFISRKTTNGIPKYEDRYHNGDPVWHESEDIYIVAGTEDLVYTEDGYYRPKTEVEFSKIKRLRAPDGQIQWSLLTRDGTRNLFGKNKECRVIDGIFPNQRMLMVTKFCTDIVLIYQTSQTSSR